MIKIKLLAALVLTAGLLLGTPTAYAHCDSVEGPVAKAALAALDTGNVHLVLPYAPVTAAAELKGSFAQSAKVRALGPEAKALADRTFIETAVRLHRAGEGATYTGLKPAGIDYGPAIAAAERAIETGNLTQVKALLDEALEHGLQSHFVHVVESQTATREPKIEAEVAAARARVSAELGFVTYVEGLRQAADGAVGHTE